jgi:hypothetical protein
MNIAASNDPRIQDVRVTEDEIIAYLADAREGLGNGQLWMGDSCVLSDMVTERRNGQ